MQISSRFTVALHVLACVATFSEKRKVTSAFLAESVNTNAVIIRNILLQLKSAGLVRVDRGTGGAYLAQPADEISLLDVYKAVEPLENGKPFRVHDNPNKDCPVGRNILETLEGRLSAVQDVMELKLRSMSLSDILSDLNDLIGEQKG